MIKNIIIFILILLLLLWQFSFYNFFPSFLPIAFLIVLLLQFYDYQKGAKVLTIVAIISFEYFSVHFYGYYFVIFVSYYFLMNFLLRKFLVNRSSLSLGVSLLISEFYYWFANKILLSGENLFFQKKYFYPFDYYFLIKDFIVNLIIILFLYQVIKYLKNKFWSSNEIIIN